MTLGLLDLSIVTDRLLRHLSDCEAASRLWLEEPSPPIGPEVPPGSTAPPRVIPDPKFTINFTGLAPDAVRDLPGCSLSLFLFHVAPDKFHRNTFPLQDVVVEGSKPHTLAPRARRIPQQPLPLTLYYLLSAHSGNYIEEQQAMSIALKCFHENPVVKATVPAAVSRVEEFTLTMEPQSVDEIGRLWLSLSTPLRLSAVYRASVIFIEPETPPPPDPKLVHTPVVKAYPQFAITRATVDGSGLASVIGGEFVTDSIVVTIDSVALPVATTNPPGPGTFRVASATTLLVQLPTSAVTGQHRLGVRLAPGQPEAVFTLDVP